MLPSETQRLQEILKQRHERRSLVASPGRTSASCVTSPSAAVSQLNQSASDNGTPSPVVPHRELVAVPEQHQPFIANIL
jgi:hypothetical protein